MRSFRNEMFNFRNLNLEMKKFVKIVIKVLKRVANAIHIVLSIPLAFLLLLSIICLLPFAVLMNKTVNRYFNLIMDEL